MKINKLLVVTLLSAGLLLAGCGAKKDGNKDNTPSGDPTDPSGEPQETWNEMAYANFKAEYDAKQEAPYNHVESMYGDSTGVNPDGTLKLYKVVEDYLNGQWTLNVTESDEGVGGGIVGYFGMMIGQTIQQMGNPPEGATATAYKSSNNRYKIETSFPQQGGTITIHLVMDKYFYGEEFIQKSNAQNVLECYSTWSTK